MRRALLRRAIWLAIAAAAVTVLALAATLEPDARGHGTHEQLGLPPCGFFALTGAPCPACELTTAFAYLARADLFGALSANAGAIPLFALTLAAVPFAALGAVTGRRFELLARSRAASRAALVVVVALLLAWVVRVCPG